MQTRAQQIVRGLTLAGLGIGVGAVVQLVLRRRRLPRVVTLETSVTIRREPAEIYRFWRELSNLPRFMSHVECVVETPGGQTSWIAKGPLRKTLEWQAQIVDDRPGERIAWRSLEGSALPNHGAVLFRRAPGDRGTEVHLTLGFEPPGRALGIKLARLFGTVPKLQLMNDFQRLKQILETSDVMRSDASVHSGPHPAG